MAGNQASLSSGVANVTRDPQRAGIECRHIGPVEILVSSAWRTGGLPHAFSTRAGGTSTVYAAIPGTAGEMNLGYTESDDRARVDENRRRLLAAAQGEGRTLITLRQIHSSLTHRVATEDAGSAFAADGLMTDDPAVMIGVQTADCVPVLVRDRRRNAVAAFHAGWRGTLQRIVESGVGRMRQEFGSRPEDLEAAIGPAIGACCYAVGEEVANEFHSQFADAATLFTEVDAALHLDLVEANRRQLLDAGLSAEAVQIAGHCTQCASGRFYSYRAERGFCGRMMAVIGPR